MTSANTRQLLFAIAFGVLSFITVALGAEIHCDYRETTDREEDDCAPTG